MLRLLVDLHGVLETLAKYTDPETQEVRFFSQPFPGSQEAIRCLSDYYEIVLVSSLHPSNVEEAGKFLGYYFPEIDPLNYVFTGNKSLVSGDVMIDDGEGNLYSTQCPIKILFSAKPQVKQNYIQFKHWAKLADYLIEIAQAYAEEMKIAHITA